MRTSFLCLLPLLGASLALGQSQGSRTLQEQSTLNRDVRLADLVYPGTGRRTDTLNVRIPIRQFDPSLGTLRSVAVQFDVTEDVFFNGGLFAPPSLFSGVNANVTAGERLTPPGGSALTSSVFHNQTITVDANTWRNFFIQYPAQSRTSSTTTIQAPSSLSRWVGTGTVDVPLVSTFAMEVTSSNGSGTGFFQPRTDLTVRVEYSYDPAATVSSYGSGCAGTGGLVPTITAPTPPVVGNLTFTFDLQNARPSSPAVVHLGLAAAAIALGGGCELLVQPPLLFLAPVMTDGSGTASTLVPLPLDPAFYGIAIHAQYTVWDDQSPIGNLVFSDALALLLGA